MPITKAKQNGGFTLAPTFKQRGCIRKWGDSL